MQSHVMVSRVQHDDRLGNEPTLRAVRRRYRRLADWPIAVVREWRRRSRGRAELAALDGRMLSDIGVSPGDAWREINKPFWRE